MHIINPIYDTAFKYLMQNKKIASRVLEIILEKKVFDIEFKSQETTAYDETRLLKFYRLDFIATIETEEGTKETVLIELQKSKYSTDLQRFRNYLAAAYRSGASTVQEKKRPQYDTKGIYPIIAIYILGYNVAEIPYMAVKVDRKVINLSDKKTVQVESDFINYLTHVSHIIQIKRLPKKRQTQLEHFISFFNQANQTRYRYILDLKTIPPGMQDIATHLQKPVLDDKLRRQMEAEEEIDNIFAPVEHELEMVRENLEQEKDKLKAEQKRLEEAKLKAEQAKQRAEQERQIAGQEKQRAEQEKLRAEMEKQRAEEEKQRAEEEKQRADRERKSKRLMQTKLAKILLKQGLSIEETAAELDITAQELKEMLNL